MSTAPRNCDLKPTNPLSAMIRGGAMSCLALAALCLGVRPEALAQSATDGCPRTSSPTSQSGVDLEQFAVNSGASVVYDAASANLELARSGGVFALANTAMSERPEYACAGDFDEDGWTDFIGAGNVDTIIRLYKNTTANNPAPVDWNDPTQLRAPSFTPTAQLQGTTTSVSPLSAHIGGAVCGDFNGDQHQDFAFLSDNATSPDKPKQANMWLGNGDGTFRAAYKFVINLNQLQDLSWNHVGAAADYNGDGHLDMIWGLASGATAGGKVQVFLNDGDLAQPKFTPGAILVEDADMGYRGPTAVVYRDFDNDGIKDLIAGGPSTLKLRLYPGLAGGGVDTVNYQNIPFTNGGTASIMAADFDMDGNIDIVVTTDNWHVHGGSTAQDNHTGGYTYFYKNNGTTTPFAGGASVTITAHNDTAIFDLDVGVIMDYDHDPQGTIDLVIADGNSVSNYHAVANRTLDDYVECGEIASGALDLGALATEEMIVTGGRLDPSTTVPGGTSIAFFMANDDPPNWEPANPCPDDATEYCTAFGDWSGRTVRWKAEMCSNASRDATPKISSVTVTYDYTLAEEHYRAGVVVHDGVAYVGAFRQPGERGHLYATNAGLSQTYWDAAEMLDSMPDAGRNIYTATTDSAARLNFTVGNTGNISLQQTLNVATPAQAAAVVSWQRSARFGIANNPLSKLGSVVNSTPAVLSAPRLPGWYTLAEADDRSLVDGFVTANANRDIVVLFGSKDGALHAVRSIPTNINASANGQEAWAYIPPEVAYNLVSDMTSNTITSYPDGSPTLADVVLDGNLHTVALVSTGSGGKSTFALDVTDSTSPQPLWQALPGGADAGSAHSKPAVARVKVGGVTRFYAIFGSGFALDDQTAPFTKGRVVVAVDIDAGAEAWKFKTRCPLTSDIVAFETDDPDRPGDPPALDGYIDRVVFADACGYVYKVDPAKDGGGWNDNAGLGSIDSGSVMGASTTAWALFSTAAAAPLNEERPIAGTIAARVDTSTRMVLFFGTGGLESTDPGLMNAFYAVYADTGAIRSTLTGACTGGLCEKFYGGVVVTSEQVILTRTVDPVIGQNTCDFGSSKIEAYPLNFDPNNPDPDFSQTINSASISSLYGSAGAVYLTTLSGDIVSVGTPRSPDAGGDTASGLGGSGGNPESMNMSLLGWRQIF